MKTKNLLSTAETADILGISAASVSNWVRQGYLHKLEKGFVRQDVEVLLTKIRSGEIDRLSRRANKRETAGTLKPDAAYSEICSELCSLDIKPSEIMWLVAVRLFKAHALTADKPSDELLKLRPDDYKNASALRLLKNRLERLYDSGSDPDFLSSAQIIDSIELPVIKPSETDIAGIIYQAVSTRGKRSASGAFYTPVNLTDAMIASALKNYSKNTDKIYFIDPCCGSGQFILSFLKAGGRPEKSFGIDSDETAAFTAAVNIILQYPETDSDPRIFTLDSLAQTIPESIYQTIKFDLAITNPPWGGANAQNRIELTKRFPAVTSGESFSYFINLCIELIKPKGIASFVLPESITNVNRHRDIRQYILDNCRITKVTDHGRIFRKVFSPAVTIEMVKTGDQKTIEQEKRYNASSFNINLSSIDAEIIDSIYEAPYTSLQGRSDWALGLVTGNNKRFITNRQSDGSEPILRGSDILAGAIKAPSSFINFKPGDFQQSAPEWKYRSKPKLVYRFISRNIIIAVDTESRLTLNSANIILPGSALLNAGWDCHKIADFFNSEVCNFIFRKRFNSVKVLRNHLEQLPLPLSGGKSFRLTEKQIQHIQNYFSCK